MGVRSVLPQVQSQKTKGLSIATKTRAFLIRTVSARSSNVSTNSPFCNTIIKKPGEDAFKHLAGSHSRYVGQVSPNLDSFSYVSVARCAVLHISFVVFE